MKRHLLVALIIVAVSLTLFGCSSSGSKLKVGETSSGDEDSKTPTQQDSEAEQSITDNEDQELLTSFSIKSVAQDTYNGIAIKTVLPEYPEEDYTISFVNKVGTNLLIGLRSRNVSKFSLITYNLKTASKKEIYKGTGSVGFHSGFKLLNDGKRLVLQISDRALFLYRDKLEVLNEVQLTEDIWSYDISYDGKKIAYSREGDLYVSDIDFSNPQLLVKGIKRTTNDEFYGTWLKRPAQPRWSHDGTKILYIIANYESSEGIEIVSIDGSSKQIIKSEMFGPNRAAWLFNDQKIFVEQVMGASKIYVLDLATSEFEYTKETSPEYSSPSPTEERFFYKAAGNMYDEPSQFYLADASEEYPITPMIKDIVRGAAWSPTGNEVIILTDQQIIILTVSNGLNSSREGQLQVQNGTFQEISARLKQKEDLRKADWSPDKSAVIFSLNNDPWEEMPIYLWKIGQQQPTRLDMKGPSAISWSPNSKYVWISLGTSMQGQGVVLKADTQKQVLSTTTVGNAVWSPDTEWLALGVLSDIRANAVVEPENTVDLGLFNPKDRKLHILAQGDSDYYYMPKKWEGNRLHSIKGYYSTQYQDGTQEEEVRTITENLYDIVPAVPKDEVFKEFDEGSQSIWLVGKGGVKNLVATFEHGLYQAPQISPDKSKISMIRVTESMGESASGFPVVYDIHTGQLKHIGSKVPMFIWTSAWADNSKTLLLDGERILDTENWETAELEYNGNNYNLGAKPSADGAKIAMFTCQGEGSPLKFLLFDGQGQKIKEIATKLYPKISDDGFGPLPVNFYWLSDNKRIVMECWRQQEYLSDIYLFDTDTEQAEKIIDSAHNPALFKDNKLAVLQIQSEPRSYYKTIQIYDLKGNLLSESDFNLGDVRIGEMEWGEKGKRLFINASFIVGNRVDRNGVIIWNIGEDTIEEIIYGPRGTNYFGLNEDEDSLFFMEYK